MIAKLRNLEKRYIELEKLLSDPDVIKEQQKYHQYLKEHGELNKIVSIYKHFQRLEKEFDETKDLLNDNDSAIQIMAKEEIASIESQIKKQESLLKIMLIPKDPKDKKDILLEIRAGTGGEEAGIFVGDLFRMYLRYAESKNWIIEVIEKNDSNSGGFKEIVSMIRGKSVFGELKFESGTHRVQRVPETEAQGRVHTSAVTVVVLPEAEDIEVDIDPADLKIDVFRSSGPGGQSVNTTDSAVRITHLPTRVSATCQDEKSQHKNKAKAMNVLKARILDAKIQEETAKRAAERKTQVGSGDRSERIRTYNFPQGRMTDHRIGLTLYKLDSIMQGDIQQIIDELKLKMRQQALEISD